MAKDSTVTNVDPGDDIDASWGDAVKASIEAAFDDKTQYDESDAATVTFDLDNGAFQSVILEGDRTLAVSNEITGRPFVVRIGQDATGGRVPTWWSGIKWPGGSAPPLSTGANEVDIFCFIPRGGSLYDALFAGFGLI